MPKTNVNGLMVHHITVGEGPSLVMLHGFMGNLAVWHLRIAPLLRSRFRITTYDLRGHGYTQMTPDGYTTAEMAEDLRGLLDTLGIERAHLAGHSFGADICLYFALQYPERVNRLVALEPGLISLLREQYRQPWQGWSYWVEKLHAAGLTVPEDKRCDLRYLLNLSLETPKFYGPARGLPRQREPLLRLLHETSLVDDYGDTGAMSADAVSRITTPTMLIYGEKSQFLPTFEFLRHTLPSCRSVLLPDAEHFGPLERPDTLAQYIRSFLTERKVDQNGTGHTFGTPAGLVDPEPRPLP
jgi:pimeloyl-ACP methyl ester carboxylesterase